MGECQLLVLPRAHLEVVRMAREQVLDGKLHKLELKVLKPDMTARARQSYVAKSDK